MKSIIYIFSFLLLLHQTVTAQGFDVKQAPSQIDIHYKTNKTYDFTLHNYTNRELKVNVSIDNELLTGGSDILICANGDCSDRIENLVISSSEKQKKLSLKVIGGISQLDSRVDLKIIDTEYNYELTQSINVKVSDFIKDETLYHTSNLTVENFYPNPVQDQAKMYYETRSKEAKIILQNVLGSIVKEFKLEPDENYITIDAENMRPGVYFYTLLVNNEGIATKKLIIKK